MAKSKKRCKSLDNIIPENVEDQVTTDKLKNDENELEAIALKLLSDYEGVELEYTAENETESNLLLDFHENQKHITDQQIYDDAFMSFVDSGKNEEFTSLDYDQTIQNIKKEMILNLEIIKSHYQGGGTELKRDNSVIAAERKHHGFMDAWSTRINNLWLLHQKKFNPPSADYLDLVISECNTHDAWTESFDKLVKTSLDKVQKLNTVVNGARTELSKSLSKKIISNSNAKKRMKLEKGDELVTSILAQNAEVFQNISDGTLEEINKDASKTKKRLSWSQAIEDNEEKGFLK